MREIAEHAAIGGRSPRVVGSAQEVAEELIGWVRETDVDGFNLAYAVTPETFTDFVDLVVPELQARAPTSTTTRPARCGRNCTVPAAAGCPTATRPPGFAIGDDADER